MPTELIKGPKGDQGIIGLEGETGPKGDRGEIGPRGYKGEKGDRGAMGLEGLPGKDGVNGKDGKDGKDAKGERGMDGKNGANADPEVMRAIINTAVKDHEKKASHDPFAIGSKTLTESGMSDGMVLSYDSKGDRIVYSTPKQVTAKINKLAGRGLSLPSQSGKTDRLLTTSGSRSSWGMKITVSATQPTSPVYGDIWIDLN